MTSLSGVGPSAARRVTIRDVAREAGVGIKTVSRVINNEPNVAPATGERVRAVIAQL
ncbi:LacI family DNA-binding transcriptional regulator, partial [Priestia sp. SIMBA_032]|uniref:LacI family DNA-binding transcriptional regulator n=1 Tax=Priestia sp. SIMBA_032 TaxID=3085775 RepID=UPI00397825F1